MYSYETVTEALNNLKARGYTTDFNVAFNKLECKTTQKCLKPDEFEIVEHYRFEGNTDPDDEEVVYAIEEKNGTLKGVLVSAFGTYSDEISGEMISKLSVKE